MNPAPDRPEPAPDPLSAPGPHPPDYGRLTAIGPYFALDTSPEAAPPAGFRPLPELFDTGPDAPLAARLRVVAQRLGTTELRVAASILHLGLAARFWSVGLGSAVLLGVVPTLERAWVRIPDQGPIDLWAPPEPVPPTTGLHPGAGAGIAPRPASLVEQLHEAVLLRQLDPLAAAVRAAAPLSPRLLLGNAASALAGTLRVLDAHAPHTARALVAELLGRPPLAGAGALRVGPRGTAFRRSSCCLYYRIGPNAGLCGDCCFTEPPTRAKRNG
ncbi:(2Fe-2S)-binding protein [Streptomyces sp. NRRL S-350]|uniref:(2Fe-2S)-binding protein n=1 Tax=Streptomyces sp. NRRL S-350 TaxID=1463902 RepID=UPI0006917DC5|nr:(2Fe-2S)-binding protein [Streptomyces sp. NRRL S-350]